jgi:hypothetical protein
MANFFNQNLEWVLGSPRRSLNNVRRRTAACIHSHSLEQAAFAGVVLSYKQVQAPKIWELEIVEQLETGNM